jgi:hypothetical protein
MLTRKRPIDKIFKDGFNLHNFVKMTSTKKLVQVVDPNLLTREVEDLEVATKEDDYSNEKCFCASKSPHFPHICQRGKHLHLSMWHTNFKMNKRKHVFSLSSVQNFRPSISLSQIQVRRSLSLPRSLSLSLSLSSQALSLSPSQMLSPPLDDDETHRHRLTGFGNDCWLGPAV